MGDDINLQKVRDVCEANTSPKEFYKQIKNQGVEIGASPLPILAPALRALCITAFKELSDDEVTGLLSKFVPNLYLRSMPIVFLHRAMDVSTILR